MEHPSDSPTSGTARDSGSSGWTGVGSKQSLGAGDAAKPGFVAWYCGLDFNCLPLDRLMIAMVGFTKD